ncbi:MAG: aspartate-semialdehyde dehydrogenase [Clostridia bacterium]|nr:aspartate-semialdehyde dehydrogenase [Clostridia bacterium]
MKIAIVGATGLVGREILKILEEKQFDKFCDFNFYASSRSEGKILNVGSKFARVMALDNNSIEPADYAIFSAGSIVSKTWAKKFVKLGATVVDNSSAFRRFKNIPLVVPEINMDDVGCSKIIANPNCSTIALALPLFAIAKHVKIKRVVVSTYQAVSGAGKKALDDLENSTSNKLPHKITDNLIPQIDKFLANGNTFEEDKMIFELKKILHEPNLQVSATCVRVPISNCHSESVNIELSKPLSNKKLREILSCERGICLTDNTETQLYPMPSIANNTDDILVGRIRQDKSCKNTINLFLCMNNLRKGAALNAVQIVERLISKQSLVGGHNM